MSSKGTNQKIFILSPMCGPSSHFQGFNYSKMSPEDVERKLGEGMTHVKFAILMCQKQATKGRYFMFEHLATAKSWIIGTVKQIIHLPNVVTVDFDFCRYNMKSVNPFGGICEEEDPCNDQLQQVGQEVIECSVQRKSQACHIHQLPRGPCHRYIDEFCDEVCMAVRDELMNESDK